MEKKKYEWIWLDDLEYLIKITLPLLLIAIGIFGKIPEDYKQTLLTTGLFGTGLSQRNKTNRPP